MKNPIGFSILYCMISMFLVSACEKAEIQKSTVKEQQIISRDVPDDCDDCPVNDCCCYIVLTSGTSPANITFCGTDDPDLSSTPCGPAEAGNCVISGYTVARTLTTGGDNDAFFCMIPGNGFYIQGTSGSSFSMTCQYGQINQQTVNFTLGSDKVYYEVDNNCELKGCL